MYVHLAAFLLFEFSFITFACYCLIHPIPIQSKPSDTLEIFSTFNATLTEAKSAAAAMSVVWQSIACLFARDIIGVVRSAEFMAQYRQLGELTPGVSDRVSTITSGIIDGLVHFFWWFLHWGVSARVYCDARSNDSWAAWFRDNYSGNYDSAHDEAD